MTNRCFFFIDQFDLASNIQSQGFDVCLDWVFHKEVFIVLEDHVLGDLCGGDALIVDRGDGDRAFVDAGEGGGLFIEF